MKIDLSDSAADRLCTWLSLSWWCSWDIGQSASSCTLAESILRVVQSMVSCLVLHACMVTVQLLNSNHGYSLHHNLLFLHLPASYSLVPRPFSRLLASSIVQFVGGAVWKGRQQVRESLAICVHLTQAGWISLVVWILQRCKSEHGCSKRVNCVTEMVLQQWRMVVSVHAHMFEMASDVCPDAPRDVIH